MQQICSFATVQHVFRYQYNWVDDRKCKSFLFKWILQNKKFPILRIEWVQMSRYLIFKLQTFLGAQTDPIWKRIQNLYKNLRYLNKCQSYWLFFPKEGEKKTEIFLKTGVFFRFLDFDVILFERREIWERCGRYVSSLTNKQTNKRNEISSDRKPNQRGKIWNLH